MEQVLKLLGLGQRARSLVSGDEAVRAKLERRQARLVIIARDASTATQQDFAALCQRYGVGCVLFAAKAELGAALGKSPRAVVALLDEGFARRVLVSLQELERV